MVVNTTNHVPLIRPNEDDELQFNSQAFSLFSLRSWDDALSSPQFQKQLIHSGTAPRSLPGGRT